VAAAAAAAVGIGAAIAGKGIAKVTRRAAKAIVRRAR
jgi:hypothetical protein